MFAHQVSLQGRNSRGDRRDMFPTIGAEEHNMKCIPTFEPSV